MAKFSGAGGRLPLWIAPTIGMGLALAIGAAALALDSAVAWEEKKIPVFVGQPESARVLLAAIAGAVATLIALIFTIIAVVMQLASSQYSPRALYTLLQDRPSHLTIGAFVGVFTYALVVLVGLPLTLGGEQELVASFAVTLAFGLAVVILVIFAIYANHIIHWVRITSILNRHGDNARKAIDELFPVALSDDSDPPPPPSGEPDHRVVATSAGVVLNIDTKALLKEAVQADCVIVVALAPGSFVPEGAPLLEIHGEHQKPDELRRHVHLEQELSPQRWAFRQLTDIAQRALSPGVNDPATAVQVLDHLHDLLRRLVRRDLAYGTRFKAGGEVRVFLPVKPWEDVVTETLDEIRIAGEGSLQVCRRLRAILEDLAQVAPPSRKASLESQLDLLEATVARGFADAEVREAARRPDRTGTQF